jgi:xylan 1,4-beta-xylosidase
MFGMLHGERAKLTSDAAAAREMVLHPGEAKIEGVDGLAARGSRDLQVIVWNYREEDIAEPARKVSIEIVGLPEKLRRVKREEFAVDEERSNSYTAWKKMGKPQSPSAEDRTVLETASRLETVTGPMWVEVHGGKCELNIELPHEGMMLIRLSW